MTRREVDNILESFRIVIDTREQKTRKARQRYKAFERPTEQATLNYGDYCGNVDLSGKPLLDISARISPACVIERKMDLDELAGCFTRSRARFEREFQRAADADAKVYLLVEGASYEDIVAHRYRSRFASNAFLGSLLSWSTRYNITPVFCEAGTSGLMIREILLRDMRERLERGEYG
jgi:ERCC4-type nuclease